MRCINTIKKTIAHVQRKNNVTGCFASASVIFVQWIAIMPCQETGVNAAVGIDTTQGGKVPYKGKPKKPKKPKKRKRVQQTG